MQITQKYLRDNPNHIFVFGDNMLRQGKGGAAALRDEPNTYGFITKLAPSNAPHAYYTPDAYLPVYYAEIEKLKSHIFKNQKKTFLISKVGAGLANQHKIFEKVIEPRIKNDLSEFDNVEFLW